jgi:hypothetical protein
VTEAEEQRLLHTVDRLVAMMSGVLRFLQNDLPPPRAQQLRARVLEFITDFDAADDAQRRAADADLLAWLQKMPPRD